MVKRVVLLSLFFVSVLSNAQTYGTYNQIDQSASKIEQLVPMGSRPFHVLTQEYKRLGMAEGAAALVNLNSILDTVGDQIRSEQRAGQTVIPDRVASLLIEQFSKQLSISSEEAKKRFCELSEETQCSVFSKELTYSVCATTKVNALLNRK